jgi:nicotinamidase-related amidase
MEAALIVIDVQKGIDEALHWGGNRNNPEAEGNIKLLLAEWRYRSWPVVIVQHFSESERSPFHESKPGNALKDFIFASEGEELIRKSTTNAFLRTPLEERLREKNVSEVVICGFVTNNSVEATARMSAELGFKTTVVSDATASFNKVGLDGSVYPSELIHSISLGNLKDEYAEIRTARQVISNL